MLEINKHFEVAAHPVHAWKVVSDLEGFANWCSYVRITFRDTSEDAIIYHFRRSRDARMEAEFDGRVSLIEPRRRIVLNYDAALMRFEESFEVSAGKQPGSSAITHRLRAEGLGITLLGFTIRKRLGQVLSYVDLEMKHRILAVAKAAAARKLKGHSPSRPKTRR